jgi:ATP-binding cassette subfamily B protein
MSSSSTASTVSTASSASKRLPARLATVLATARLLYRSHPRAFVISALASLTEPLFYPAFLLLLQRLLQQIVSAGGRVQLTPAVELIGVAMLALILVQRLGIIVRDASSTILRQEAWVVISKRVMAKLPSVPYTLFENNAFQARYGLVIREASHRSITLVDSLLSTVPILLGLLGVAVALFTIAPLLVLALLLIAIPAAFIERRFSHAMYELQEHTAPRQLRMEALTNMLVDAPWQRDVRVYQSDLLSREHAWLADAYLADLKRMTARFLGLRSGAALVQVVGLALAMAAAFVLVRQGQISLVNLAILLPGIPLLSGMLSSFIYSFRSLLESLRYADTLFDFLGASRIDGIALAPPAPATVLGRLSAIRLEGVSYTYPQTRTTALTDISCTITPGLTAIVGTNGAGKSTLVKLVAGLIPPSTGSLHAHLAAAEQIPLERCAKAVLFQDPGHFPFSIRHNVTMRFEGTAEEGRDEGRAEGRDEAERVAAALRDAGLEEAVRALPDGVETVVGAGFGGVADLSGGQWQRLSLARLLAHDAPLLILDEPSASLDPVGERQIFALLSAMAREREKIILFTTHRYDTIRRADTIVVLVDGRIAEVGTPDELERKAGAFWSLYFGQGSQIVRP